MRASAHTQYTINEMKRNRTFSTGEKEGPSASPGREHSVDGNCTTAAARTRRRVNERPLPNIDLKTVEEKIGSSTGGRPKAG